MSDAVLKLLPLLDALSQEERGEVGEYLVEKDEEVLSQEEWETAWAEEVERRIENVKAGRSQLVDGEEVMARLRAKYS